MGGERSQEAPIHKYQFLLCPPEVPRTSHSQLLQSKLWSCKQGFNLHRGIGVRLYICQNWFGTDVPNYMSKSMSQELLDLKLGCGQGKHHELGIYWQKQLCLKKNGSLGTGLLIHSQHLSLTWEMPGKKLESPQPPLP